MKNIKNNNYSFTAWVLVVISCIFIVSIGYKSKANSDLAKIHKKNTSITLNMNEEYPTIRSLGLSLSKYFKVSLGQLFDNLLSQFSKNNENNEACQKSHKVTCNASHSVGKIIKGCR